MRLLMKMITLNTLNSVIYSSDVFIAGIAIAPKIFAGLLYTKCSIINL